MTRKCGHPLGTTRWCPDCALAEDKEASERQPNAFRQGAGITAYIVDDEIFRSLASANAWAAENDSHVREGVFVEGKVGALQEGAETLMALNAFSRICMFSAPPHKPDEERALMMSIWLEADNARRALQEGSAARSPTQEPPN